MKKIVLMVMLLIISGCSSKQEPVSQDMWGYEFNQNQLAGSFAFAREATESQEGIYFLIRSEDKDGSQVQLVGYFDKTTEEFSIMDNNINSKCSVENFLRCSSFHSGSSNYINYYNEKLFFVESVLNPDTGVTKELLIQMDVDGGNRKEIDTVTDSVSSNTSFSIIFHKGTVFYTYGNDTVTSLNLENLEKKEIQIKGSKDTMLVNAENDSVYIVSGIYNDGSKIIENALIEMTIEDGKYCMVEHDMALFQFKKNAYVYYDYDEDSINYNNNESNENKKLKDGGVSAIIGSSNIILADRSDDQNMASLYLFDSDGNLKDTYYNTDDLRIREFAQIITDDYLYGFRINDLEREFFRISIDGNKFGELQSIFKWKISN